MKAGAAVLGGLFAALAFSGCFGGPASDWAYRMVGVRDVQKEYDGTGIRVAIVDTGIDGNHSSLDHARIVWKDEINGRPHPYDDVGHGSHVAGIVVGKGSSFGGQLQGYELKGAAPQADLIVVKAIRAEDQKGPATAVINGINFAIQSQADVICLSLGSQPTALDLLPNDLQRAVDAAINQGILVVASAGNTQQHTEDEDVKVPAAIELVIAVGAVTQNRAVADFSVHGDEERNHGALGTGIGQRTDPNKKPEIVAPGVGIRSAWKDGAFATAEGTSQAAPFVCGALALLLEKCDGLRAQNSSQMVRNVKTALMKSAEPVPQQRTPHDNAAGYGLLRADQLLDSFGANC